MSSARRSDASLPGEQQQARERRAEVRRKIGLGVLAVLGWALLVVIVGPTRASPELPPLGPAARDLVALRDFDDQEPVHDLAAKQEQAVAAVPIHYAFDKASVTRRVDALHDAFRLVRPRYRLYVAERERLLSEAAGSDAKKSADPKARRPEPAPASSSAAVADLDRAFLEELDRLRPEFEAGVAARRAELAGDVFSALRKAGFAEEIELLLTDVAQVLLNQRIVRDLDRFEDDLARGVLDASTRTRYDRATARGKVVDVEGAQRNAEELVAEFVKQKRPSRLDDPVLNAALRSMARSLVDPTFSRDMAATRVAEEAARVSVPQTRVVRFERGQALVKRGEMVTPRLQERFSRMQEGLRDDPTPRSYVATALLLAVALVLFFGFARRHLHHFRHRPRDAQLLAAILLIHAAVLRLLLAIGHYAVDPGGHITPTMWMIALPFALGPTLATLFLRPFTAAPFTLLCALVATVMAHNTSLLRQESAMGALVAVESLIVGLAGVHAARQFRQRSDLVLGALTISAVAMLCAAAIALYSVPLGGELLVPETGMVVAMGAASGALSYLLLAALTPIFESLFNRLTDIKLVELASMNHPALRLLATEAPGTFTHSVMVGNLAQAGCEAIGANGLLARVGAYYHDLGKTRAPKYFAENQTGDNPHDRLKPHLSALIIKAHVKDGIKILKSFGLPDEIIDFVPQHHGTSLIAHFYHRAQREAQETGEEVTQADFRYPGPKPQRKETALLMLADSVEAAAKALPEPNPTRVQALVKKIIAGKLEDGQFDECDLTLRELALVEQAFVRTLVGIHHTRPVYLQPAAQPALAAAPRLHVGGVDPLPTDEVKRVALLADGGVGVRVVKGGSRDTESGLDPALSKTDQTTREAALRPASGEAEAPQSPTAVVAARQDPPQKKLRGI